MHSACILIWVLLFSFFTFNFPSLSLPFPPSNNITLLGDAHFKNNTISLTQELNCLNLSPPPPPPLLQNPEPSPYLGVGRALYAYPIQFLDSATNTTASFSCRFSFSITPVSPLCTSGDGIAFLITSHAGTFNKSHGYMGLPNLSLNPQDSFFAVEFDTSFDSELGDINGNHIGIDLNTVVSYDSVDGFSIGIDLQNGKELTAWIEYRDSEKMIRIWVGHLPIRPANPIIVSKVDLSNYFNEFMHVGFSAANGQGSAIHIVSKWQFKTYGFLPLPSSMTTIEETDCFMCFSDDPSSTINEVPSFFHKNNSLFYKLGFGFGGLAAIIAIGVSVLVIVNLQKSKDGGKRKKCRKDCIFQAEKSPTRLSLSEIKSATMGFNKNRVIGEGASAIVYKGHLPSGEKVAVKRFRQVNQLNCSSHPFTTEFATMAGFLSHKNLVELHGWCCEANELVLVYEYLPNGSLDKLLHKNAKSAILLTWEIRLNIVLDIASALIYLHEECERQIIHRDIKSCNIMLGEDFSAKLGDFGLAEIYDRSSSTRDATIPAGTMGYLAPEYVYSGVPTVKTDVYSFGVVMLEIVTGRKPVSDDGMVHVDWVWDLWANGKVIEAVDSRLMGKFRRWEMERMIMVGLSCVHPNCEKRPTVKQAAKLLRGESRVPDLPLRKPTVRIRTVVIDKRGERSIQCGDVSPGVDETAWLTPRTHFS